MQFFIVKYFESGRVYEIADRQTVDRHSFIACRIACDIFDDFDAAKDAVKKLDEYNPSAFYGIAMIH